MYKMHSHRSSHDKFQDSWLQWFKDNGFHFLTKSANIRRYALLEEVWHSRWTLRIQKLKPGLIAHCLLLLHKDPDIELSATCPLACLLVCRHASCYDDNGLTLSAISCLYFVLLYKKTMVMASLPNSKTLIENDRGRHLSAVISRIVRVCKHAPHRDKPRFPYAPMCNNYSSF